MMIDNQKVTMLKRLLLTLGVVLAFLIGFGFGQMGHKAQTQASSTKTTQKQTKTGRTLNEKWVKQFLIAYYTKKDLEENRNRYKDYMTQGLYQATISEEETAQNQAYKGFVVNFVFQDAQIYIDQTNHKAICEVTYTNDLLQKKDSDDGAQKGVVNHTTIELTYSDVGGKYLVNQMSTLLLTDSSDPTANQEAYGDVMASNDE